jgi:hypothetical protein
MTSTVRITFGSAEVVVNLPETLVHWPADEARRWLDEQFNTLGCEPLRASGKVLTIDKLLAIATAIGQQGFERDEALRQDFALAAQGALARPLVLIDVEQGSVTF